MEESRRSYPYCFGNLMSLNICGGNGCPHLNECAIFTDYVKIAFNMGKLTTHEQVEDFRYSMINYFNSDYWVPIEDILYMLEEVLNIRET